MQGKGGISLLARALVYGRRPTLPHLQVVVIRAFQVDRVTQRRVEFALGLTKLPIRARDAKLVGNHHP